MHQVLLLSLADRVSNQKRNGSPRSERIDGENDAGLDV